MTQRLYALLGASLLVTAFAVGQAPRTVQVDVNYTGSGTVDASHKIYVALWESTDFNSGPAAGKPLGSKTGTVTSPELQKSPVCVGTAYAPTGKWEAQPSPPAGSSLGMYSTKPPTPD